LPLLLIFLINRVFKRVNAVIFVIISLYIPYPIPLRQGNGEG
jgi:hypothetical protein